MFQSGLLLAQNFGFRFDHDENRLNIPFLTVNNLIVVPVTVNDSIRLNFILDTGVKSTILTDNSLTDFDLSGCRPVHILGAGGQEEVVAFVVTNVRFALQGITSSGMNLIVLSEDYLKLQNHLGMDIHGILGYDLFSQFVVKIDYERKMISLYDPETYRPNHKYKRLDMSLFMGRPYIESIVKQNDGSKISANLLIDSGASHSLMLETDSDSNIYVPGKHVNTIVGWGLSGELNGFMGRIDSLKFAGFGFHEVLCTYTSDYGAGVNERIPGRKGSIGGELLSRFTIIFDYSRKELYLKRNSNFRKAFIYNMGGVDLIASGASFKLYKVIHIIPESPAEKAGLMVNDIVLSINGEMITEMSIQEVNGYFRTRPKSRIRMLILRDQKLEMITFRLEKLI
jgi:hypothetical protein